MKGLLPDPFGTTGGMAEKCLAGSDKAPRGSERTSGERPGQPGRVAAERKRVKAEAMGKYLSTAEARRGVAPLNLVARQRSEGFGEI